MKILLICTYCNFTVPKVIHTEGIDKRFVSCSRCGDKNLKIKDISGDNKIDYYKGCPPFPEKKESYKEDWRFE